MVVSNHVCEFYSETIREKAFPFSLANIFFNLGGDQKKSLQNFSEIFEKSVKIIYVYI